MRNLLVLLLLLGQTPAHAGDTGTSAGQFLTLGADARGSALGEAYTAVADDASAVRSNPAAMTRVEGHSVSLMHAMHLKTATLDHLAYVRRVSEGTALGLSLLRMDYGSITKTDTTGAAIGSARPGDTAFTAGAAHALGGSGLSLGLSLSYIQSKIVDSANTVSATAGLLTAPIGDRELRGSLVAENLLGKLKYDQKADPLPMTIRLGGSLMATEKLQASAELISPNDADIHAAIGLEQWLGDPKEGAGYPLRVGYNTRKLSGLSGLAGLSLGLGARFAFLPVAFDYAFVPFGDLGDTHRLSLSMRFGSGERRQAATPRPEPRVAAVVEAPPVKAGPPTLPPSAAAPAGPTYDSHTAAGSAALAKGDFLTARSSYRSAAALLLPGDERHIQLSERLGAIAVRDKEVAEAKKHYIAAIGLAKQLAASGSTSLTVGNDSLVNAYLGLAWCLSVQGQTAAAEKNYRKGRELTDNPETQKRIDQKLLELKQSSPK